MLRMYGQTTPSTSAIEQDCTNYKNDYNHIMLTPTQQRFWQSWLMAGMIMVALMVFIGGLTRLTESGLSIVEWKVLSGVFPPMTQASWEAEFLAYQATPEFQKINSYFTLADFKRIFWLEYIHRVFGRITGLLFALPFLYCLIRRTLPATYLWRMAGFSALVGIQGLFGWIMVKSGLIDDPRVNPLNLSLHLCTAFLLFGLLYKQWLKGRQRTSITIPCYGRTALHLTLLLITIQILFGAWVAGWDAGLTYNSYPLMDGRFIPDGLLMLEPMWRNPIENIMTVQFQHRVAAKLIAFPLVIACFALYMYGSHRSAHWLLGSYILQIALGITTLIYVVPIALASLHQMGAMLLLATTLYALERTRTCESPAEKQHNNPQKTA